MKWEISMIKHHPSETLLTEYCSASLSASLSLAVSIHVDMCPVCQEKVAKIEASNADALFSEDVEAFDIALGHHLEDHRSVFFIEDHGFSFRG